MIEREIALLRREISALKQFKQSGRNMTGLRLPPTNLDNRLEGDLEGDYLFVLPDKQYTLQKIDVYDTLKWIETPINTGF